MCNSPKSIIPQGSIFIIQAGSCDFRDCEIIGHFRALRDIPYREWNNHRAKFQKHGEGMRQAVAAMEKDGLIAEIGDEILHIHDGEKL